MYLSALKRQHLPPSRSLRGFLAPHTSHSHLIPHPFPVMATMASQHGAEWPLRSSQVMQMSPFQQPNHIELSMNMFPSTSAPSMVPFSAGAYGFDLTSMNQYPVQQNYNISYTPAVQPPPAYASAPTELPSTVPQIREARNALPSLNRSPSVKAEAQSPIHANQAYGEGNSDELKNGQADGSLAGVSFSTDVDCLMKAIQSKQKQSRPSSPKAAPAPTVHVQQHKVEPSPVQLTTEGRNKARKRYHCSIPGCNKSFYQKTHLEIHTRAHTGVKPFVCKEPSCGQRFSQLGNLKVCKHQTNRFALLINNPRLTSGVTPVSDRTTATNVGKRLRNAAMFERTKLFIYKSSRLLASSMNAESNSHSLVT